MKSNLPLVLPAFAVWLCILSCKTRVEEYTWKTMDVTVSAYNSVPSQTDYNPNLAAWGDTLKPGMKCVAVSRDLIRLGIKHNTQIKIEGMEGIYLVKDKMHSRWQNRVDIYMGVDVKKAREWGRKKLSIEYAVKKADEALDELAK